MYIGLLLVVIFMACLALMFPQGLWSNALTFFNVMTSALLASNYFEPLADYLEKQAPSYKYLWDFLALWIVFAGSMMVLRTITDLLSKVKVKFIPQVNLAGGIFFAAWTGWIMVGFTTMTLHTAPLARNFFLGAFQETPETHMMFGLGPDRKWLAFLHKMSQSSLSRSGPAGAHTFDPEADFVLRYGFRRADFEDLEKSGPSLRTNK
jgi:uncharacterized membrane protein required for colicin V production